LKPGAHIVLLAAARFYAPLIVLIAFALLVVREPGAGVGFVAGLVFASALALHLLVFGAAAARVAFPPFAARLMVGLGLAVAVTGAAGPRLPFAAQLIEAGLFLTTAAGASLIMAVFVGRAPTLRDEDA
jgi:multisubunit Na+/H+ antiporter MnhB subunit